LASISFSNPLHWEFYTLLLEDTLRAPEERQLWVRDSKDPELMRNMLISRLFDRHPEITDSTGSLNSDALADSFPMMERTLNSIENGINGQRFANICNEIKKLLQQQLPKNLCEHIAPLQIFDPEEGNLHKAVFEDGSKPKKAPAGYGYGIPLRHPHEQVT
jgi:hypothetical protein